MKSPFVGSLLAVVVVAIGGVGYVLYQRSLTDAEMAGLVAEVDHELGRQERARSDLTRLLRKLTRHEAATTEPRLIRARARLQLALDQLQEAWETESALAADPDRAEPADLLLGATILKRRHALGGDREVAAQAMGLAERHYDASGIVPSLFMAWQCARRAGRDEEATRLAQQLAEDHADSWEGRLTKALDALDAKDPAAAAADLEQLVREVDEVPEELDLALAFVELAGGEDSAVETGVTRLQGVLDTFPASTDARSLFAGAMYKRGEFDRGVVHLRWLLKHADPDDERRPTWQRMLDR